MTTSMTATPVASQPEAEHPSWCAHPGQCRADHLGENLYVAATGDEPEALSTDGAFYKSICVAATHDEDAGEPLGVLMSICGLTGGESVTMRPREVRQLAEALQLVLGQIGGAR